MRQLACRAIVKRYAGFIARGFNAEDQQKEGAVGGAWQNRRKSLLYWAFCRYRWWKESSQQHNFRPSIRYQARLVGHN